MLKEFVKSISSISLTIVMVLANGNVSYATPRALPASEALSGTNVRPLITAAIDENRLVTLAGNTRPEAKSQNDIGRVPDDFAVEHVLLQLRRSPEQERALDRYIDSLNDKNSANFHNWLSAEEFGERYGLAQEDLDTITGWLRSHGFVINKLYANHILIDFSGTAREVREAFHTELHYISVRGKTHISNMSDPRVPAALVPAIGGLNSLNDFKPHPMYRKRVPNPLYTFAGCTTSTDFPTQPGSCYAVTPGDEQVIYNLTPLYPAAGAQDSGGKYSGQGVNVAVVEDTDTYSGNGDWNYFRKVFGLGRTYPYGTYTTLHPGSCTDPGTNGDDGEAAIDVEEVTAFAPNSNVYLISCPSTTFTFGGQIAMQNLINEANSGPYQAPGGIGIISVSYGLCEAATGAGGNLVFNNTYQQAATEGVSVFVSSGDELATSCGNEFSATGADYPYYSVASVSVTGWGDTPYNVSVGGTDYEDVYNAKEIVGAPALSGYWNATNNASDASAKSYIPEIPWNDSCASVLIANYARGSYNTYGASGTGMCNTSPYNSTTASYLEDSMVGASGGASNCAVGSGGLDQTDYLITTPYCQGYAKPSWQSVYGNPADGVRDIPDVSLFASNGVWGHFGIFCWSDPSETADGAATCDGKAPSSWSGFGGTSLAAPSMAAIQSLVNEKTGQLWGNPNPIYYQIGRAEYGTAGGSFLGGTCNSSASGGPASGCTFNDVTQGDIDAACRYNGTVLENHCYKPSTNGVLSTDAVSGATVINGGTGYTSAPTCTVAQPSNLAPYISPSATTLWAGGTQATCTATVSSASTTAKYTLTIESATAAGEPMTVGPNTYTLTGATTTAIATNLAASINTGSVATATSSGATVTVTAKTAGYAGNFSVSWGAGFLFGEAYVEIVYTTLGQGPNYVSGITVTAAGTGYGPNTPITLTGGGGTGAIAVANTTPGTPSPGYEPAFGAANGWDMATGLGTVNAYNLVMNAAW
jgi:subtilase family serine protease